MRNQKLSLCLLYLSVRVKLPENRILRLLLQDRAVGTVQDQEGMAITHAQAEDSVL